MLSKIKSWINSDILECLILGYRRIPALYKTTFWTLFSVLNIVFFYHTVNFFFSNHDWTVMFRGMRYNEYWWDARFTGTLPYAFMGFELLPVLLNIFGFAGLAISSIMLARYWYIPKTKSTYICFGLLYSLLPYNLCWLYHIIQTSYYWGIALIVTALFLFDKIRIKKLCVLYHIPVILLLYFVLGLHAAYINVMCICVAGHYFIAFINKENLKDLIYDVLFVLADFVLALLLLKGSMVLAAHYGFLATHFYNVQHIQPSEAFSKFIVVWGYILKEFWITYPFLDAKILHTMQAISLIALICALIQSIKARGAFTGTIFFVLMLFSVLFATQLAVFISNNKNHLEFLFRLTGYFGIYYFFLLMSAFLFLYGLKGVLKNVSFLLVALLIGLSVQRDMYAMKVWKFGRDAEDKLYDRIMTRIENLEGFRYQNRYFVLVLGDISLRSRYYRIDSDMGDVSTLLWSYRSPWEMDHALNFYAPENFVFYTYSVYWNMDFVDRLIPRLSAETLRFIKDKAAPWPDKNSVFMRGDNIFIFLSEGELKEFQKILEVYLKALEGS